LKTPLLIIILCLIASCHNKKTYNITLEKTTQNFTLSDLNNNRIKIQNTKKAKVFFTLDPECPLCKSYSKKMNEIHSKYNNNIDFYGFLPSAIFNPKKVNEFIEKNNIKMQVIVDTTQILTNFLNASVTPECFLLDSNLNILYNGLIDDWIKELGRKRQNVNNNYLEDALNAYANNKEIIKKKTKAIGCIIEK
jgi:peroxiredoxin